MRNVSLEWGPKYDCGKVLVMYFWLKPYLKFWSFFKKFDARTNIIEDSTWNIESYEYYWGLDLKHRIIEISFWLYFQLSSNSIASIGIMVERHPPRRSTTLCVYFLFFEMLNADLQPTYMVDPVFSLMSPCTSYKAYTHHLVTLRMSSLKISGMYIVPHRYWIKCCNFRQSSLSVSCTPFVRKSTAIWV